MKHDRPSKPPDRIYILHPFSANPSCLSCLFLERSWNARLNTNYKRKHHPRRKMPPNGRTQQPLELLHARGFEVEGGGDDVDGKGSVE